MRNLLVFISLCVGVSCNLETEAPSFSPIYSFADEIKLLTKINPFVNKTVTKDGISKKSKIKVDWKKELRFFAEAEINNPKFQSEYVIDTTKIGNKTIINCTSHSDKIKTKHIQYVFNGDKCEMIYMQRLLRDRVNNNYQEMYYQPGIRYEINGTQKVREIDDFAYKVVGKIDLPKTQSYVFELKFKDEVLPFFVEFNAKGANIKNGSEEIQATNIYQKGDSTIMDIPVFNSELRYVIQDGQIKGRWCNLAKGNYSIPLESNQARNTRFEVSEQESTDFTGKWEVLFSPETEDKYPAIGVFEQNGNEVTGTFLTETGDYRFLEGNVNGNEMFLSCFDGAHAFLFKAKIEDNGELSGTFFSGKHWQEPWSAIRNEKATLSDPFKLTYLEDSTQEFSFSFPNLDSVMVSNKDERYKNKVVLVQIMGSWCPNCMDETKLLSDYYSKYNEQGLEVISLCFEASKTFEGKTKAVKKLKSHFNTRHEYLIAGSAGKACAEDVLPQLNHIMSFPTTLFIDKTGTVRKIHTGFYGPGTGPYYEMYVDKTTAFIEQLLKE
ncbi:MAG: TlpA family protein disulfide reductase [Flavobacteriales bacterium]|nr:TlpA family protein disulfide reductase [Flavobacteriales bacterium]